MVLRKIVLADGVKSINDSFPHVLDFFRWNEKFPVIEYNKQNF